MSGKFGLDWKKYDSKRMMLLMHVMGVYNKAEEEEVKRSKLKNKHGR
jgi:hypothetical protein